MHPYKDFPPRQFWQQSVGAVPWAEVLAQEHGKFTISAADTVASAGSCFAQRISRVIAESGLDYRFFERPHPLVPAPQADSLGYGTFSCRYGNVYTTRQLLQLVREALGHTPQRHTLAQDAAGRTIDLLRPAAVPGGFESADEAVADRAWHLQCVARMLAESDVFIFTLGLTETWVDAATGTVYGNHPSVITRRPSPLPLQPLNLDYLDCYNDLVEVLNLVRGINPRMRYVFTVSPVALAATHQPQHVLVATAYSKAVLRAVAGRFAALLPNVDYFPSFEIFNQAQSFGQFLSDDLRDVSPRGVQVAMATFRRMFLGAAAPASSAGLAVVPAPAPGVVPGAGPAATRPASVAADVECEEMLNGFLGRPLAAA